MFHFPASAGFMVICSCKVQHLVAISVNPVPVKPTPILEDPIISEIGCVYVYPSLLFHISIANQQTYISLNLLATVYPVSQEPNAGPLVPKLRFLGDSEPIM